MNYRWSPWLRERGMIVVKVRGRIKKKIEKKMKKKVTATCAKNAMEFSRAFKVAVSCV